MSNLDIYLAATDLPAPRATVIKPDACNRRNPGSREYTLLMQPRTTARVSLTALLGTPVTDAQGHLRGRLKDIAVATGPDAGKVAGLVLKTRSGLCIVPSAGRDGNPCRHA